MVTNPANNKNDNNNIEDSILVDIIEFPFEMDTPAFNSTAEMIDGAVLHLNTLYASETNTVIVKSNDTNPVHLIAETHLFESGIVDAITPEIPSELLGYHFYRFEDDLTLLSLSPLIIL